MTYWIDRHAGRFGRAMMTLGGDQNGVTILEYVLIAALIAAVCVGATTTMGADIRSLFGSIRSLADSHS